MKAKLIRFISIFVAIVMLISIVPFGSVTASAAYENTYSNTGNQRIDIVGVALSQIGYMEGANNDTKYGDWYGLPNQPWCAMFVSWCARQANIPTSVLKNSAVAAPDSNYFNIPYYSGSSYTPKPGDLFFTTSFSHVGLVYYVDGDYFYTIEGNSNDSGSSEGIGVFSLRRKIDNYYFGVPNYGGTPSHKVNSSYGKNFTAYPKSKITAENIFDEYHNITSSTAWIGTSDKCTIYEVYTDGCCKLSYPLDSGGTRTVYSKISLFNTHIHNYTGTRVHETAHPHAITQRCTDYSSCGGYKVTGEYAQVKSCEQCWYASFDFSASSVSLKVGESKTISAIINGFWPDTMVGVFDYDTSRVAVTTGQNTITFKGLKVGTCTLKLIIYSDSSKSHIIGSKSVKVTVSDPTYTGEVSFDKSSISLVRPTNNTSKLTIELTGTWPEGAGYTFDYDSNVISMAQNGTILTITAKKAGSTNFTINIVNKNNNNALITSAVCPITVKNATYTIKYDANGGSGAPSAQTKTYGTPIQITDGVPQREGYVFRGWALSSTAITPEYVMGDKYTLENSDTLYAVWEKITLDSIKVYPPDKYLYYMGESLDTSGLKLRLEYTDGSTSVIDKGYSVSGFDSSVEGHKNVTVSYGGKTDSFEVMVISSSVSLSQKSITLNLGETKTISAITDPVGCYVKWSVWDNSVVNVSDGKITAVGVGETKIVVAFEWEGYYSFATCDVTVNAVKTLSSISVESKPTKTVYEIGESLNTDGLKLKLKYSDGSTEIITSGFTTSGFSSTTAGTKTVTVKYGSLTTTFIVTVNAPTPVDGPRVTVESKKARVGSTVLITVSLEDNPGIWGMDLVVNYDKTQLTLTSVTNGTVFSSSEWTQGNLSGDKYILSYEASGFDNITTNGVLATLEFTVNENATVDSFASISLSYNDGDIINVSFGDINVAIVSGGINITDFVYGDLNSDGLVNKKDSLLMKMYLADNSTTIDMQAADVYIDGSINKKDSLYLKQFLAGLDVELGA